MGKVFVTGDIHGLASNFIFRLNQYIENPTEEDILICVGDVGLEYGNQIQGALKKAMKKFPGTIYIMRGNHDNRYWANHIVHDENNNYYLEIPKDGWRFNTEESPTPNLIYQKKI